MFLSSVIAKSLKVFKVIFSTYGTGTGVISGVTSASLLLQLPVENVRSSSTHKVNIFIISLFFMGILYHKRQKTL